MNTYLLPSPASGRILLLVAPDALVTDLFEMIGRLALQGPLYVLDGGNTFQGYFLARVLRRQVRDIAAPMQRVLLSRAFTCYQMSTLIEGLLAGRDFEPHPLRSQFAALHPLPVEPALCRELPVPECGLPHPLRPAASECGLPHPVLVLDFLGTFYDQDVRVPERLRLLRGCIHRLQELARRVPVAMWVRQRSVVPQEALHFLEMVQNAAGQVWFPPRQPALPALKQGELFPG